MNATDKFSAQYFNLVRDLFRNNPDTFRAFEDLWQAGKFREAYIVVDEAVQKLGLDLSIEQQKIDEAYYWAVIN